MNQISGHCPFLGDNPRMFKNLWPLFGLAQIFLDLALTKKAFEFKKNQTATALSSAVLVNGPDINNESFVICCSHYQKYVNTKVNI